MVELASGPCNCASRLGADASGPERYLDSARSVRVLADTAVLGVGGLQSADGFPINLPG